MNNTKQKQKNLVEMLSGIKDHRRAQGRMHDLNFILLLVIMATMSGFFSLRAIGDFIKKNQAQLLKQFKPSKDRLPSYLTVGRALQNIDFNELSEIFYQWASNRVETNGKEWVSMDGKAMKGTMNDYSKARQKFISLISVFASVQKQALAAGKINNKKESEIPKVKELIEMLGLKNAIFTLDALHCQKDTTRAIVKSGNDYCIGVKGNQKKLYERLKKT
jgi:hypothetical protein